MLFTDYSLPLGLTLGLPVRLLMLLPVRFLPLGMGVERREEKRREEIRPGCLPEKLNQAEARLLEINIIDPEYRTQIFFTLLSF